MLQITDAQYVRDFILNLSFNNSETYRVDLQQALNTPVHRSLLDHKEFVQYALVHGTIEWANGADFAPEYLLELGREQNVGKGKVRSKIRVK